MLPNFSKRVIGVIAGFGLATIAISVMLISGALAASTPPTITEPIFATYHASELTITGSGFDSSGHITFSTWDTAVTPATLSLSDPSVELTGDHTIQIANLPPGVVTGTLSVTSGKTSDTVPLLVFAYESNKIPGASGGGLPLAIDVDPTNGTVWFNSEHNRELKALIPGSPNTFEWTQPPQAAGAGIFVYNAGPFFCPQGDPPPTPRFGCRSTGSAWGEDILVRYDGLEPSIWFTQGGSAGYKDELDFWGKELFNTSRVVRYRPTPQTFDCYNAPERDANALGVLIDEPRGIVWYSEADPVYGSAIMGIKFDDLAAPNTNLNNCLFDPYTETPAPICTGTPSPTCHYRVDVDACYPAHMELDGDGYIWFTEFWGHDCSGPLVNAIARLDPITKDVVVVPLPDQESGNGFFRGSGPWELEFDDLGNLWIGEFFDASVLRVNLELQNPLTLEADCGELNPATGQNDCIDVLFVGYDDIPAAVSPSIHTINIDDAGRVWFGVEDFALKTAVLGFISTAHGDEIVLLPSKPIVVSTAGVIPSGDDDIWFAEFFQKEIGHLRLLHSSDDTLSLDQDGDGLTDAEEVNGVVRAHGTFFPDPLNPDTDGDGCIDGKEVGSDETLGGLRDPLDPWDYYDVQGPFASDEKDGVIDLPNDILGVILNHTGNQGYTPGEAAATGTSGIRANYDRGPSTGGDHWKRSGPDGVIDLPNDILGVILQFGHNCS